jgi:hypothetical protein
MERKEYDSLAEGTRVHMHSQSGAVYNGVTVSRWEYTSRNGKPYRVSYFKPDGWNRAENIHFGLIHLGESKSKWLRQYPQRAE